MRLHFHHAHRFLGNFSLPFALACLASACSANKPTSSEKEDLMLSRPFPVDATDAHVRFEFEATPENVNLTRSYIVGLNLSRKGPVDPVTTLNNSDSPVRYALKVNACKWEAGSCDKIFTEDNFQALLRKEPSKVKFFGWRVGNPDIKYIESGAHNSDSSNWIVCNLHLRSYGRYRVDISSVAGNPVLNIPEAEITIQKKLTSSK
ncbi:hypothetical protein [Xanthomonas hortorum]|uniref:DUF5625 domain-containing protein n=2 Tax=Xanthomonas hortorum TaxID=56454 RepID=A0A6V7E4X4_9XANT|nr:hypothetical protein [Xanthomonas hortorum]MCE4355282.1 hypothetical protein [Xanthomonas hortorum pv. pelargonii]MCM5523277.1 hypothetical protein [Xanthomonas hortorum pv. pelargonii]MCM5535861.1 hypothetical protein [Xanthomonas hortorum pv. pelargonii]MCM5539770.1 hypothetical protein [Xanthomonas hortorum pv. pelargonii]MCM5543385.1 hypothetical protein [Xanthomonas hortorum pv. pelargonii]